MATDHIIVHASVATEFRTIMTGMLAKKAEESPLPKVVSMAAKTRLHNVLAQAGVDGATAAFGTLEQVDLPGTAFVPTVLEGLKDKTAFWEDEAFGPVVALSLADSVEGAIELANRTGYGLSAAVFTKDLRKGLAVAKRLETG